MRFRWALRQLRNNYSKPRHLTRSNNHWSSGDFIITYNKNSPFCGRRSKSTNSLLWRFISRPQVKYLMDTLTSSFIDFQLSLTISYCEKSNCVLWQGTIYVRSGKTDKARAYFAKAKQAALNDDDKHEANEMIILNKIGTKTREAYISRLLFWTEVRKKR